MHFKHCEYDVWSAGQCSAGWPNRRACDGERNKDKWLPALIKTSKSLGYFPDRIPDINWIPVDKLAATILEIFHFAARTETSWVYNTFNPRLPSWSSNLDSVRLRLGPHVQVVLLRE